MMRIATRSRAVFVSRQAISVFEFLGCLVALVAGAIIGSMYLGVDVKAAAIAALEKADIEVPAVLAAKVPCDTQAPNESAGDSLHETGDQSAEVSSSSANSESVNQAIKDCPEQVELSEDEQQAATLAFWANLNQSIHSEKSQRSLPADRSRNLQLYDYLLHRQEGHAQAAEAIEQLDQHGVDSHLQTHGELVLQWHQAGETLYERAIHLLTSNPGGKLTGPFAQSWQSAATQHRMEESLLLKRHAAIENYMQHSFKPSTP